MRKKFKSIIGLTLAVIMTAGLSAGCGNKTETESSDTKPQVSTVEPKKDVTLTVAASANWIRDIDKTQAEDFTKKTGIKVDIQTNPDDQYANVVKTKLSAGEGPDIYFSKTAVSMLEFFPAQYALDLSNEPWVSKYVDEIIPAVSFENKVIGLCTWSRDVRAMIYNSELFKKYNIAVPTNYNEFLQACETLKKNNITPIYGNFKDEWYSGMMFDAAISFEKNAPGTIEKLNDNSVKFAGLKEAEDYLVRVKECIDKGYYGKNYLSDTYDKANDAIGSGKYAMWYGWSSQANDFATKGGDNAGPADKYLMFPAPWTDDFKTYAAMDPGLMRVINKGSKNIDAAKEYFNYITQDEVLQAFYDARPEFSESTLKNASKQGTKGFAVLKEMCTEGSITAIPASVNYLSGTKIGRYMQEMFIGTKTPKQVLEATDKDRDKLFKAIAK